MGFLKEAIDALKLSGNMFKFRAMQDVVLNLNKEFLTLLNNEKISEATWRSQISKSSKAMKRVTEDILNVLEKRPQPELDDLTVSNEVRKLERFVFEQFQTSANEILKLLAAYEAGEDIDNAKQAVTEALKQAYVIWDQLGVKRQDMAAQLQEQAEKRKAKINS